MNYQEHFKGKKITVMGLGLLGRGAGDAKFLAEQGAELVVTDLKTEKELASSLELLKEFSNITYRLGGHDVADFKNRDYILKAAGIPSDSPFIAEARKEGIPIKMSASWFAEIARIPFIGVTGTRGKSTVTHLLEAILKAAHIPVILGGNVRGISTLALLPEVKAESLALMELDSWQCQGFGEAKLNPHIAIFTTFMPDHMNYYHGSMDAYLADKAQIFLHQKPEDTLIVGSQAAEIIKEKYGSAIPSHLVVADPGDFPQGWKINLLGVHNLLNAMCAIDAARTLGINDGIIKEAIGIFTAVPGRLQFLKEVHGIAIYNDNSSTTPEATMAALRAIPGSRAVLIMGGADKGLDLSELASLVPVYAKKIILLKGNGTDRLVKANPEAFGKAPVYEHLEDALKDAMAASVEGDLVLFSPAFTSFSMYANEFERGDEFTELVSKLA